MVRFRAPGTFIRGSLVSRPLQLLRENFLSLANKISEWPVFKYFEDFGSLVPDLFKKAGLQVSLGFAPLLGALMKDDKSHVDKDLKFLGIWGEFPCPYNDMLLMISLHAPKKEKRGDITLDFVSNGGVFP